MLFVVVFFFFLAGQQCRRSGPEQIPTHLPAFCDLITSTATLYRKVPRDVKHLSCLYKRKETRPQDVGEGAQHGRGEDGREDAARRTWTRSDSNLLLSLRAYRVAEADMLTLLNFQLNIPTRYDHVLEWHYGDDKKHKTFVTSVRDSDTPEK